MKTCSKCKLAKDLDCFHNNFSRKDGKHSWCKVCLSPVLKKNKNEKYGRKRLALIKQRQTSWKNLPNEEWRKVVGFEELYEVSNLGRLRAIKYGPVKKAVCLHSFGYMYCGLQGKTFFFHRIIAEAFIPNPNNYPQINHINGIRSDNTLSNLEWCTAQQNMQHAIKVLKRHGSLGGHFKKYWDKKRAAGETSSQFVGVSWSKATNKWNASITISGASKNLGFFNSEQEASDAYQTALKDI